MDKQITVVITDDHMVVRKGLKHVIQSFPDIRVAAEAENGEEALFLCKQLQPDVILMDVQMEGMGGVAATRVVRQFYPHIRVIALSTFPDREMATQMLAAKANGYLLKNISAQELENAIRAVHAGETVFSPEIVEVLESVRSSPGQADVRLSKQQKKVLALLSEGLSNVEIADRLNVSQPTARYHVSAILVKLGVANRVEAATFALKQGLLEA